MKSAESPGEAIKRLMLERRWSQIELAYVLGVTTGTVNQVVNSKRPITPEMAKLLGVAFNTPAQYFADLQARWDLARAADPSDDVHIRALIQSRFPLREMIKRGWINETAREGSANTELCRFFCVNSLEDAGRIAFAARKSDSAEPTGSQLAWLYRVRAIAREMPTPAYSKAKLQGAVERMSLFRKAPEEARHVAGCLHEAGVRFVVVEGLPGGRIDGVCTWLDDSAPVIGLSLRLDRIDNFWFVLRHECAHVLHRHGNGQSIIDQELSPAEAGLSNEEIVADTEAADFCVSADKIQSFFLRKNPFFSEAEVRAFSKINNIHPGLAVGQLQYMSKRFNLLRQFLVSIRKHVISAAMVDGWGNTVPIG